jgi:Asp/Glu/hydantoin racemase
MEPGRIISNHTIIQMIPTIKIEIVSCLDAKLWYADRIGKQFDVINYNNRYCIVNNPLFSIHPIDCTVITEPKISKISNHIIKLLEIESYNTSELHTVFCEKVSKVGNMAIINALKYLHRHKKIIPSCSRDIFKSVNYWSLNK